MSYSLAQAAGVNRSTVLRAIKSGKISGQRDAQGTWTVEPVELHRVLPPAEALPKAVPQRSQADAQADAQVGEFRAQLAEMRSQRDAWHAIAERLALRGPPEPEKPRGRGGAGCARPADGPVKWRVASRRRVEAAG
jgi:hypothetical protein